MLFCSCSFPQCSMQCNRSSRRWGGIHCECDGILHCLWISTYALDYTGITTPYENMVALFHALKYSMILRWKFISPMSLKDQVPPLSVHFDTSGKGNKWVSPLPCIQIGQRGRGITTSSPRKGINPLIPLPMGIWSGQKGEEPGFWTSWKMKISTSESCPILGHKIILMYFDKMLWTTVCIIIHRW